MFRLRDRSRTAPRRPSPVRRAQPGVTPLEGRVVLSAVPLGPKFQIAANVSPNPPFDAKDPASGRSVVAWAAAGDVYFQLYNPDGTANGSPVNVTPSSPTNDSGVANLAMNGNGQFVILWTNTNGANKTFQRFSSATGAAVGSLANIATTGGKPAFSVGIDNSQNVVVLSSSPPMIPGPKVFLQKFNASNAPVASWTVTTSGQYPSLSMNVTSGQFVVGWTNATAAGVRTIRAQRFTAAGAFSGAQLTLTTAAAGHTIGNSSVAINASGQFVMTWSDQGPGSSFWSVWARQYDPASGLLAAFQVEPATTYNATYVDHHIALDNSGQFLIVWSAPGTPSGTANFGRFYAWS